MLNEINDKEKLLVIKEYIKYALKNGLDNVFFEQVLKELLPNNNGDLLIDYRVLEKGYMTALFRPHQREVLVSVNKMNEWLDKNCDDLRKMYKIDDLNEFRIFLSLFVVAHEIEHAKQFFIGNGEEEAPNILVKKGYEGIFDLFYKDESIFPRPIKDTRRKISLMLYKMKENNYILERNANVEGADYLTQLALYMNKENIFNVFNDLKTNFLKLGYVESNMGCLEETYRNILMYDKYKKIYKDLEICCEDRIRYGLSISDDTRIKILKK